MVEVFVVCGLSTCSGSGRKLDSFTEELLEFQVTNSGRLSRESPSAR